MEKTRLLAAIGRAQLPEVFRLAAKQPFVVFGTLDGRVMSRLDGTGGPAVRDVKVYLYETG